MKRVFINKWFILASLLTISLSAFSFMAFRNVDTAGSVSRECCHKAPGSAEKSELLWDLITRQLPTVSFQ